MPVRMRGWSFGSYPRRSETAEAEKTALSFARGQCRSKWLVLSGSIGWGKTGLAVAVLNARLAEPSWGKPGLFTTCPDLLGALRAGYRDDTYERTLAAYKGAPLVVFDDLGAEYNKAGGEASWADEQLYMILAARSSDALETIVTTNVPLTRLNERIADRLLERRLGFVAHFDLHLPSERSGVKW